VRMVVPLPMAVLMVVPLMAAPIANNRQAL